MRLALVRENGKSERTVRRTERGMMKGVKDGWDRENLTARTVVQEEQQTAAVCWSLPQSGHEEKGKRY